MYWDAVVTVGRVVERPFLSMMRMAASCVRIEIFLMSGGLAHLLQLLVQGHGAFHGCLGVELGGKDILNSTFSITYEP